MFWIKGLISAKIQFVFFRKIYAKVAQLVEHNVANVRVVGSNPIFRSKVPNPEHAEGWGLFLGVVPKW